MRVYKIFLLFICFFLSITQAAAFTLSGTIYGGANPLSDATIVLTDTNTSTEVGSVTSDANGDYLFTVPDGSYNLDIQAPAASGFGDSNNNPVTISGADETLDVYLISVGDTLSGTVYLPDGTTPASNVRLKIFDSSNPSTYLDSVITDGTGEYSFTVASGTYGLSMEVFNASNAGLIGSYLHQRYLNNIVLSTDTTQDITLPFVTISGRTVDGNGVAVPGVDVSVPITYLPNSNGGVTYQNTGTVTSDASGNYAFSIYTYSSYTVTLVPPVSATGLAVTSLQNVDLSVNDSTHDFQLQQGIVLSGTVFLPDGTTPASNVRLKIFDSSNPSTYLDSVITDGTGEYSFTVASGTYGLSMEVFNASNAGLIGSYLHQRYLNNIVLSTDTTQDITLPFVTISGRTVDGNGVAVPGVDVSVPITYLPNSNGGVTYQNTGTVTSDASGNYAFSIYTYSSYTVTLVPPVSATGLAVTSLQNVDLSVNDSTHDFQLQQGIVLSGTVFLPDGTTPASNVRLKIFDSSNPSTYLDSVITDGTGEYSFTVASGTYGLSMEVFNASNAGLIGSYLHQRYLNNIVLSTDTTQDITLPFVTISGRTVDGNGVAVPGVDVSVPITYLPNSNGGVTYQNTGTVTSDASGNYAFSIYTYSSYTLTVNPPTGSGFSILPINSVDLSIDKTQIFVLPFSDVSAPLIVAGPYVKNITDTTAVIEWQTDEPATSDVTVSGVTTNVAGYRTQHSVQVSSLIASTLYNAQVSSTDESGNGPVTSELVSFTTLAVADTTPPVILTGPIITAITQDRALVRWTTSEPATSSLSYGISDLSLSTSDAGTRVEHELEITGLIASTQYSVQVHGTDINNNGPTDSSVVQFSTLALADTNAPIIISGPLVSNISDTEATIIWETSEPATSGVSSNDGTAYNVYRDESYNTHHEIRITGLTASTSYNFVVSSTDELGNGPSLSEENSFITLVAADTLPPVVTEPLKIVGITHKSAVIHWRTDEPSDSVIEYGLSADSLDSVESKSRLQGKHVVRLVNLNSDTEYFIKARSKDAEGNEIITTVQTFTTRSHPDHAGPRFTETPRVIAQNDRTATIYWETDEPADSVVSYGSGETITHRRSDKSKKKKHQITLTDLSPNAAYSFEVESCDSEGNRSKHRSANQVASTKIQYQKLNNQSFFIKQAVAEVGSTTGITTDAAQDITAPQISVGPEIVAVTSDYALLHWVTNEASNSSIQYGYSGGQLDQLKGELEYATDHLVVLTNLSANTNYDVQVKATDLAGNQVTSSVLTFVTSGSADTTIPNILSDPGFNTVTDTELLTILSSDEYTVASVQCVDIISSTTISVSNTGLSKAHTLHVTDLIADRAYDCEITIQDVAGNIQKSSVINYVPTNLIGSPGGSSSNSASNNASGGGGALSVWYLLAYCLLLSCININRRKQYQ